MATVSFGNDTYGRVKAVAGTPIVTQFWMLQAFPIFPLRSFYYAGIGQTKLEGIPLLASTQSAAIQGIPLSRVNLLSVLMAYVRAIFAVLVLIGFMAIFPIIITLTGERLDEIALIAMRWLIVAFGLGVVGGLLTYIVPLTSRREIDIRRQCGELLGIAADPAYVPADIARMLVEYVQHYHGSQDSPRVQCIGKLIATRAHLAQGGDRVRLEELTDELLEKLHGMA